jgi:hydrogenase maturation factor
VVRLELGKLADERLEELVLSHLPLGGRRGPHGGRIEAWGSMVLSHDVAVGLPPQQLGFFGFHYAAADVASCFAIPLHLVLGIYLPVGYDSEKLTLIARWLGREAKRWKVDVLAGHTGCYVGVRRPIVSTTCIGQPYREPSPCAEGDAVFVVGPLLDESLWINNGLSRLPLAQLRRLSPLRACLALGRLQGVEYMHDVAEGGLARSLIETSKAVGHVVRAESRGLALTEGAKKLIGEEENPWWLPSFGAEIFVVDPSEASRIRTSVRRLGLVASTLAELGGPGVGATMDGRKLEGLQRTSVDALYGSKTLS